MTDSLSPITFYDVNVLESIKGSKDSRSRTLKISHRVGYDEEQGAILYYGRRRRDAKHRRQVFICNEI